MTTKLLFKKIWHKLKWSKLKCLYLLYSGNNGYWIGQNDREQEGVWRYAASTQCPVYLNWDHGSSHQQPNGGRDQNCMVTYKRSSGRFQDKSCTEKHYTLCKFKKGVKSIISCHYLLRENSVLNNNGLKKTKQKHNSNNPKTTPQNNQRRRTAILFYFRWNQCNQTEAKSLKLLWFLDLANEYTNAIIRWS